MLRNCACVVIAHMVDATQLCLCCNCTHAGCSATVLVLSLHTWWMLRNCACLVIAHMVDATQLSLSCHCTHGGCYATVLVLSLHTWWMLRNCACLVIAHMVDATQQSWGRIGSRLIRDKSAGRPFIRTCHCHIYWMHWANWPKKQTMLQDRKKTSFFRRRLLIRTNSIVYSFLKTRTHGKNGTKSTYEPTNHTWNSTPSQHFVHLQQNAMLISLRVAITAVTLFTYGMSCFSNLLKVVSKIFVVFLWRCGDMQKWNLEKCFDELLCVCRYRWMWTCESRESHAWVNVGIYIYVLTSMCTSEWLYYVYWHRYASVNVNLNV